LEKFIYALRHFADSAAYLALVEKCLPLAAMTDHQQFFDAQNDTEKFHHDLGLMMAICTQLIAHCKIDVFATSQYNFRA
jgi:hypothetical protein